MAEFWDYSNLTNIEYRENQSTFYLDGTYVNLPPNCVIETYYDRETYKYSYKFLMLTLLNNTDTENENMQVATYTINSSGSVFIAYGDIYNYTPIPKFNRRDFLRRLFQYYISMINDKHHFMIYRPWLEHQLLMSYNTLYLRVKTGENEFVSIPYSGNDGPIIALYNSEGEQVYCSAYKYSNGQIYNSISSSIYLNNLSGGIYTVKLLRTGKGILSFVGGKYSVAITIPKADRYHNSDGTYNSANNTSKWINQPYNNLYLDFEAEYLEFDVKPIVTTCSQSELPEYTKFTWTPPGYQDVKQQVEAIYKLWGGIYENRTYDYEKYLEDFFTGFSMDIDLLEKICPIYAFYFDVIASVHKGEKIENRGKVSFNYNITYLNGNAAAYIALGDSYNPKTYVSSNDRGFDIETSVTYARGYLGNTGLTTFSGYYFNRLESMLGVCIATFNEIRGNSYPMAEAVGGYYNVGVKMLSEPRVNQKRINYIKNDEGTISSINIPCLSINAQYEYDQLIVTGKSGAGAYEGQFYGERDTNIYNTPQENINKRVSKYLEFKEQAIAAYNNSLSAGSYQHSTSQNGMKFDVPIALILGLIPEEKLYIKINNYDFEGLSNFFDIAYSDVDSVSRNMNFVNGFDALEKDEYQIQTFKIPKVIEGSIDYTGYEQCEDYRNWVGTRIYRPTSIDIDLSEIPVR